MDTSTQGVGAVFSRMQERDWLRSRAGIRSQLVWVEPLTPELGDVRSPGRKEKLGAAARHDRRDTRVAYMAYRKCAGQWEHELAALAAPGIAGSSSSSADTRRASGRRRSFYGPGELIRDLLVGAGALGWPRFDLGGVFVIFRE
jgi:hypothetical protein